MDTPVHFVAILDESGSIRSHYKGYKKCVETYHDSLPKISSTYIIRFASRIECDTDINKYKSRSEMMDNCTDLYGAISQMYRHIESLERGSIVKLVIVSDGSHNEWASKLYISSLISDIDVDLLVYAIDNWDQSTVLDMLKSLRVRSVVFHRVFDPDKYDILCKNHVIYSAKQLELFDSDITEETVLGMLQNMDFITLLNGYMFRKCIGLDNSQCADVCRRLKNVIERVDTLNKSLKIKLLTHLNTAINRYLSSKNSISDAFNFKPEYNPKYLMKSTLYNKAKFGRIMQNVDGLVQSVKDMNIDDDDENKQIRCAVTMESWYDQISILKSLDVKEYGMDSLSIRTLMDRVSPIGIPTLLEKRCAGIVMNPWLVEIDSISSGIMEYVSVKSMDDLLSGESKIYDTKYGDSYDAVVPILPLFTNPDVNSIVKSIIRSEMTEYLCTVMICGTFDISCRNSTPALCSALLHKMLITTPQTEKTRRVIDDLIRTIKCFDECFPEEYVKKLKSSSSTTTDCDDKYLETLVTDFDGLHKCHSMSYHVSAVICNDVSLTDEQLSHVIKEDVGRRISSMYDKTKNKLISFELPLKMIKPFVVIYELEKLTTTTKSPFVFIAQHYVREIQSSLNKMEDELLKHCKISIPVGGLIDKYVVTYTDICRNLYGREFVPDKTIILNAFVGSSIERNRHIKDIPSLFDTYLRNRIREYLLTVNIEEFRRYIHEICHVGLPDTYDELMAVKFNSAIISGKYGLPINTCSYRKCPMYGVPIDMHVGETNMSSLLSEHLFVDERGMRVMDATHKTVFICKYEADIHSPANIQNLCNSLKYYVRNDSCESRISKPTSEDTVRCIYAKI